MYLKHRFCVHDSVKIDKCRKSIVRFPCEWTSCKAFIFYFFIYIYIQAQYNFSVSVYLWIKWRSSLCLELERIVLRFPFHPFDVFFFAFLFVNFFFHSFSFSDVHSFPPYCSLPQNFNIQNLKHYFIFLSSYFIPVITPFDGSYMKVPFYLRLFSQKFDSCVIW